MISFAFIYTSVMIIMMTILLIREVMEPDIIIFSVLILLTIGGVVSVDEAFAGFANQGMITVGFLYVVAAALQQTGLLNKAGERLLGRPGKLSFKLLRFLFPVSFVSGFFNNTPIVAMMIPAIRHWAQKHDMPISKFMIPLSYASILGGLCTLIGTSTTLVVHGMMLERGMEGLSFFEITKIGAPIALVGLLILCLFGHRLLPHRKTPSLALDESTREFVIEMKVEPSYRYIGVTIEQAGLRHLKGLYLFQIERSDHIIISVGPDEVIQIGDRLFFTGLPETILELQRTPGLSLLKDAAFNLKYYDSDEIGSFEVVVSENSPLIGKNVRNSKFRSRYDAVILAIHRSGERIRKKIGDIVLRAGDTLLILAHHDFGRKWYHSRDFYLVSRAPTLPSKPRWYTWFSLAVLAAMIIVMATGALPILIAVCLASAILVFSRCITPEDARRSVQWSVLLIIGSAFGISKAMVNSGVAELLATNIISWLGSFGTIGLLAGIYLMAAFYTEIITNNAAAALVFPIALAVTQQAGLDPLPFCLAVAVGASASFATPIGYQTNLMVYGPGGYRFRDFLKVGLPFNFLVGVCAVGLIYYFYLS